MFGGRKKEGKDETKNSTWEMSCPNESEPAQLYIFCGTVRKNKLNKFAWEHICVKNKNHRS